MPGLLGDRPGLGAGGFEAQAQAASAGGLETQGQAGPAGRQAGLARCPTKGVTVRGYGKKLW